jgi:hypothetical protein
MQLAVLFEAFDGGDGFSGGIGYGELAGAARRAIQKDGAGAALAFAAAVFGSGEAEFFAQGEKQRGIGFRHENTAFSVDLRWSWHGLLWAG